MRAVLHTRLRAFGRKQLLRRRIGDPIALPIGAGTRHRVTVPASRVRRFLPGVRHAKVQHFGDLGNRIAPGLALDWRNKPAGNRKSAFPARDIKQPFHGVVHRSGKRNTARIRQRLERVRLAGGNARMHPDPPLPDDHRYLHAASVREANHNRRSRYRADD